ncbi:MAG TPA: ChrR family anti-sigma-E factor [Alphaproteobacteria bacterium]|nr:ChrR family anti-sigma-E factor [Alphaproteobacteria bacterium]
MSPRHHPPDELILDYAAGSAPEPVAVLVATHLALCPACRDNAARLERVGGALLDDLPPAAIAGDALERALARLDRPPAIFPRAPSVPSNRLLPAPLSQYVTAGLDGLAWRRVVRGIDQANLTCGGGAFKASILRISAGRAIPRHTHRGTEMLMVLDGAFSDETGRYGRGDVEVSDETVIHRPVAEAERDCLCLIVTAGPIRLTGIVGRLINPFIRG